MSRIPRPLVWAAQPVVIGLALWLALGGTPRDVRAPLVFSGDGLVALAQAKWIMDHDSWWAAPDSGRPADVGPLPANARLDRMIVRVAHFFSRRVPAVVTMAWALMLMLAGAATAWCVRRLGASAAGAWCAGVLFALCPFALYRNTADLTLMPYLVPFAATASLLLASGRWTDQGRGARLGLAAGSALLGLNAVANAMFGAFFLAAGAIAGSVRSRRGAALAAGAAILAALVLTTAVNLVPDRAAWRQDDRPGDVRVPTHAESFGLKIRHLVSPLPGHWFPPFRLWTERDERARFQDEPEPSQARLGLIASVGFIGLLVVLLVPSVAGESGEGDTIRSASRLTLAAILLATVGGLGTVVNLLASPHVAVYARITPFIAFFSLAAMALAIDRATGVRHRWRGAIWAGVLIIGLLDQSVALRTVNAKRAGIAREFWALREFVSALEQRVPAGALILQLPFRPYPVDPGVARMGPYDHFKPGLISPILHWSYPAGSADEVRRQNDAAAMDPRELPEYLARQGYSAIVVDRLGYQDGGAAILGALQAGPSAPRLVVQDDRYVALCLANCKS